MQNFVVTNALQHFREEYQFNFFPATAGTEWIEQINVFSLGSLLAGFAFPFASLFFEMNKISILFSFYTIPVF